jgi:hypothetical protein
LLGSGAMPRPCSLHPITLDRNQKALAATAPFMR